MDLSTTYMGIKLKNPLVAAASPLSEHLGNLKELEDAGIAAIVLYSIFEEQIIREIRELNNHLTIGTESFAESLTYFPEPKDFVLGPKDYLEFIRKAKKTVSIPIIGSLNGSTMGGWTDYAKRIEDAGADALELNIYFISTDIDITASQIEEVYIDILRSVKSNITIPVAVKISPCFSSMANMAKRLDKNGVAALVLFNRFYQPDIDLKNLEVVPNLLLSTSPEMRLPLRWIAILHGHIKASLAASTGIHEAQDVIKMLMVGADVTMLCSTLLKNGVKHTSHILNEMTQWMKEHEYNSVKQMQGTLSQKSCEDPQAFERANYMKALRSFR